MRYKSIPNQSEDYIILICQDKISICPAETDWHCDYIGKSNFIPAFHHCFPPCIWLDLLIFLKGFPLLACVKTLFDPTYKL